MGLGRSSDTDSSVFLLGLISCMELLDYRMLKKFFHQPNIKFFDSLFFLLKLKKHIH